MTRDPSRDDAARGEPGLFQWTLVGMTAALLIGALLGSGCATVGPPTPPRDGEAAAVWTVWHDAYGRDDRPPKIHWVRGETLSCTDPTSNKPGFPVWLRDRSRPGEEYVSACREGYTLSVFEVNVADHGEPYSQTAMAHELMHVWLLRQLIIDDDHERPEWQPGAAVDRANEKLREQGQ